MANITQQFENLHTRKIDRVFFESWDREPEQWPEYLQNEKGSSNNHTNQILVGIDKWTKRDNELENPVSKQIKQGPLNLKTYDEWLIEVTMSRAMIDDERYGEVEGMSKDAGEAGRQTVERDCATVLDNAFDSNEAIYDGKALCANDHPNYGSQGGTQSNLAIGALNDENLRQGIILFRDQKDETDKEIMARPTKLIIRHNQQFVASVILQSSQVSGTANNDKNPLPNLRVVDLDYMTNENSWFLQGENHQLAHRWRVQPEFKKKPFLEDNQAQKWLGYFRHQTKIDNWRKFVGSTGI